MEHEVGDVLAWHDLAAFGREEREWALLMAHYCRRDRIDHEEHAARYGDSTFLIMSVRWQRELCQALLRPEFRIPEGWGEEEWDHNSDRTGLSWIDHAPMHTTPSTERHSFDAHASLVTRRAFALGLMDTGIIAADEEILPIGKYVPLFRDLVDHVRAQGCSEDFLREEAKRVADAKEKAARATHLLNTVLAGTPEVFVVGLRLGYARRGQADPARWPRSAEGDGRAFGFADRYRLYALERFSKMLLGMQIKVYFSPDAGYRLSVVAYADPAIAGSPEEAAAQVGMLWVDQVMSGCGSYYSRSADHGFLNDGLGLLERADETKRSETKQLVELEFLCDRYMRYDPGVAMYWTPGNGMSFL